MTTDTNTLTLVVTYDFSYVVDNVQPQENGPINLSTSVPVKIPFTNTSDSIKSPDIELNDNNYMPSITVKGEGWTLTSGNVSTEYTITHSADVMITINVDNCRVLDAESNETDTGGGGIAMVGTVSMIVQKL